MKASQKGLFLLLCWLPAALFSDSIGISRQADPSPGAAAQVAPAGEELLYEVSWLFVKLGTIRLRVLEAAHDSDGVRVRARADIDSYIGLPFADLHVMTETVMDSACYSLWFLGSTRHEDTWKTIEYRHVKEKNLLFVERGHSPSRDGKPNTVEKVETLSVKRRYQDGMSILYFARANVTSDRGIRVSTVVEGAKGSTAFEFPGERTTEEIDAVRYPVDVIKFHGNAEFEGIFGLTGAFEGWFSNDQARVPMRATMEVIVGSVKVELKEWHRPGWEPPRAPPNNR